MTHPYYGMSAAVKKWDTRMYTAMQSSVFLSVKSKFQISVNSKVPFLLIKAKQSMYFYMSTHVYKQEKVRKHTKLFNRATSREETRIGRRARGRFIFMCVQSVLYQYSLYCATVHEGLEHPQILVSEDVVGINHLDTEGWLYFYNESEYITDLNMWICVFIYIYVCIYITLPIF